MFRFGWKVRCFRIVDLFLFCFISFDRFFYQPYKCCVLDGSSLVSGPAIYSLFIASFLIRSLGCRNCAPWMGTSFLIVGDSFLLRFAMRVLLPLMAYPSVAQCLGWLELAPQLQHHSRQINLANDFWTQGGERQN